MQEKLAGTPRSGGSGRDAQSRNGGQGRTVAQRDEGGGQQTEKSRWVAQVGMCHQHGRWGWQGRGQAGSRGRRRRRRWRTVFFQSGYWLKSTDVPTSEAAHTEQTSGDTHFCQEDASLPRVQKRKTCGSSSGPVFGAGARWAGPKSGGTRAQTGHARAYPRHIPGVKPPSMPLMWLSISLRGTHDGPHCHEDEKKIRY